MNTSVNPVGLQIVVLRHCIDMCVYYKHACAPICMYMCGKFNFCIYKLLRYLCLQSFILGFEMLLWLITDGV